MWVYVGGRALYLNIWSKTRGMCMDILPCGVHLDNKIKHINPLVVCCVLCVVCCVVCGVWRAVCV